MGLDFLEPGQPFLDDRFPLPIDEVFTRPMALAVGLTSQDLSRLVAAGHLRRLIEGVYVASQVPDAKAVRLAALRLVVPPHAVVTDRTAAWLHGARMTDDPADRGRVPRLSVFDRKRGGRYRNGLLSSGQRMMPDSHVVEMDGVLVTTPLRTACDLGRNRSRDRSYSLMCAMLATGLVGKDELVEAAAGFKGYRFVRQLRALAPLTDHRFESPYEAVTMLRWLDCSDLPAPEPQRPVRAAPWALGPYYYVDLGIDELRFGIEYDGEEFHGPGRSGHDEARRRWIVESEGWVLRVVRYADLQGPTPPIYAILRAGIHAARQRIQPTA